MQVRIFKNRAFAADNVILFLISIAFVPMFLFASLYSQISLGDDASNAGLYIGTFFFGYVIAAQWGGRILDTPGRQGRGRPRLRDRGRRLLPVGEPDARPRLQRRVVAARRRRRRHRPDPRPGQHRRAQPRPGDQLRRGDGHHPDGPQPRRDPRPGRPRHPADLAQRGQRRGPARLDRRQGRGRPDRRIAESGRRRWRIRRLIGDGEARPGDLRAGPVLASRCPPRRSSS